MDATQLFAGLPGITAEPGGAKYAILDLGAQAPVSYTHLDVYKRQLVNLGVIELTEKNG